MAGTPKLLSPKKPQRDIDGSVRRSGTRLRIATQLVDAATGIDLWADRFDCDLADIFDVEDRITETVIGLVEPQIRRAKIERARRKRPDDLGAYDLYRQALPYLFASPPDHWTTGGSGEPEVVHDGSQSAKFRRHVRRGQRNVEGDSLVG